MKTQRKGKMNDGKERKGKKVWHKQKSFNNADMHARTKNKKEGEKTPGPGMEGMMDEDNMGR